MENLIVVLLVGLVVLNIFMLIGLGFCVYLGYRTLVRPEAPCYAGMASPKFGMMSIDPSHPAYNALAKKLAKDTAPEAGADGRGHYL